MCNLQYLGGSIMVVRIKDVMDKPIFLNEDDSLEKVYSLMKERPGTVVVNKCHMPIGIITQGRIMKCIDLISNYKHAKDIMEREFITLHPEDLIEECTEEQEIWPIVESGYLVGVIYTETLHRYWRERSSLTNSYLDHVLMNSLNGIIIIDNNGMIRAFNQAAKRLLNLSETNVIGKKITQIIPTTGLMDILKSGEWQDRQKVTFGNVTILANRRPIMKNNEIIGAVAILLDISEQEFLTHTLQLTKKFNDELESIIDACSEGVYISDGYGVGLRVNRAYERITGVSAKELLGKNMADVVAQGIVSDSVTLKVLEKKETITITQKIKGGKEVLVTGNPIFDDNGLIKRVVTTVRDITELNLLHKKITEMNERSEKYYNELLFLRKSQFDTDELTFVSKAMMNVVDMACHVAQFDSTCLLLGESGVGKDVIARLIHMNSSRNNMPFIKINCGAIPHNLLEAELFGYEGGAFTGARKEGKPGMFEIAHTGTLFLDEIGEMPLELQVKLLQVLQDKNVYRVGGTKRIKVDVRIIAATNRNLEDMVQAGKFREDLYYRLNIVPIEIPPLRERPEDILPLAEVILQQINQKYGKNKQLSPEVIQCLLNYNWPGNVRELKNIIERLVVISSADIITTDYLPKKLYRNNKLPIPYLTKNKLKEAIEEVEKHLLTEAIKKYKSLSKIASELGVDKSTVCRKIQRYKIKVKISD